MLDRIATGVTSSKTVGGSISVDSGELIGGFSISAEVSVEASMEATGPEEGARLANGAKVTHRIIAGILFGVMVRTTYADIDLSLIHVSNTMQHKVIIARFNTLSPTY